MNILEYQEWTLQTALYPEEGKYTERELNYLVHGLVGEAGELANKFKKLLRNGAIHLGVETPISLDDSQKEILVDEMGDILWYFSRLSEVLGATVESIAGSNVSKLMARKKLNEIKDHS